MRKRIVLTGGGSAGHVTPNLALIPELKARNWQIDYIGSLSGIEHEMIAKVNIPYHGVRCGKLRRYFSWRTFIEPFNIFIGMMQSYFLLRRLNPNVVFSKGGFVAFPVVVGAWLNRIPVVAHESDMTPGLANRLSYPFVDKICLPVAKAKKHFKNKAKLMVTGIPVRQSLHEGSCEKGLEFCKLSGDRPCILVIGGSLGAQNINLVIRESLEKLCDSFQVIHLCGRGKVDSSFQDHDNYCQLEYVHDEMADLYALADIVISRSGATSLYETLSLNKPHVLIPLSMRASRGDQIHNAQYFKDMGISYVIDDEKLNAQVLVENVMFAYKEREKICARIKKLDTMSATNNVISLLDSLS